MTITRRAESMIGMRVLEPMIQMARETPPGCFVEVGVYKGGSAQLLHEVAVEQGRRLYLYDTFTGIPFKDSIDSHIVGDFNDTDIDQVREVAPTAIIVQGIFPESIVAMGLIAFAHIDCDQYRSVLDCCIILGPMMVPGGVMWFDDWECLDGATAAIKEIFEGRIEEIAGKGVVRF